MASGGLIAEVIAGSHACKRGIEVRGIVSSQLMRSRAWVQRVYRGLYSEGFIPVPQGLTAACLR